MCIRDRDMGLSKLLYHIKSIFPGKHHIQDDDIVFARQAAVEAVGTGINDV